MKSSIPVMLLVVLMSVFPGCNPSAERQGGASQPPTTQKPHESGEPASDTALSVPTGDGSTVQETPKDGAQALPVEDLPVLRNGSFEDWRAGLPSGWQGSWRTDLDGVARVRRTDTAFDGLRAVRIVSRGQRTAVWQDLNLAEDAAGGTLEASAYFAAPLSANADLRLVYKTADETKEIRAEREESDTSGETDTSDTSDETTEPTEWTRLVAKFEIPEDFEPGSLRLVILVREMVNAPVVVDGVEVVLM